MKTSLIKKSAAFLLAMAMLALAACSGSGGTPPPSSAPAESSTAADTSSGDSAAATGDQITLKFMMWEASPAETAPIDEGFQKFMDANPNITVEKSTVPWAEHHPKLRTMMAAGTAPDVFFLNPDYQRDFINNDELLDLTDLFSQFYEFDDFIPSSQNKVTTTVEGFDEPRIFGVDVCVVGPVLFYNKDMFDAAGVPYPPVKEEEMWTWDEFVENMKKLTVVEDGKTTVFGTSNFEEPMSLYTTLELLGSNGAKWFNDDFTQATGIDSDATRDTLTKIKELRTVHGVAPDPNAIGLSTNLSGIQLFMAEQVASIFIGSYSLTELSTSDINYGAGLPPKMADGYNPIGSANIYSIWAGTQYPEQSLELVSFLTSMDFGSSLYKAGLWMPNRHSMYTEEKKAEYLTPDVYPENWSELAWRWENCDARWFDFMVNTNEVYDVTAECLEAYFYNDESLDEVLPDMQGRINALISQ